MSADLILAIDAGTQSVRALVFDARGQTLARAQVLIEPYVSPQPGWAEQDPDLFWQALCQACQQLWAQGPIVPERIAGLTLTTQRATVINVDAEGKPLRPAISWLDQRRTEGIRPIGGTWGLLFSLIGLQETVSYFQAECEANWIMSQQPELWAKTYRYLLLSGYLSFRLTGHFVDSVGCQVGYIPFDYKGLDWAPASDWKWQAVPIDKKVLPDLVPVTGELGRLHPQAASDLGLPTGLRVIAAAADKACEVLGSGGLKPEIGCLSFGTTATFNTTHSRYLEVIPLVPPYPSAVPGAYSLEVGVYRGFWMVSWFRREFGLREEQLAAERGVPVESLFDTLIEAVPPGSMGLTLQPYWSPGLRVPGPEAKGAIIGWGDVHTRGHLYRAILEGIIYALREAKERTERRSGHPVKTLRVAGGGSQSDAAMQITADIFGLPAARPHTQDASGLGAAIDASVGLGLHPDIETAVHAMTRPGRQFEPDMERHALYDTLYKRVYQQMYPRLRPLYSIIRDVTGYPPRSYLPGTRRQP